MRLFRTSAWSGVAVLVKLLTSIFLNKIMAVYVGPSGFGLLGQLQSLISVATSVASGGVNVGVTKLTSQFSESNSKQKAIWSTAFIFGLIFTVAPFLILLFFCYPLSRWLLRSDEYYYVFIWLAISLPLIVFNGLILAILNGRKEVVAFVAVNIGGSLISAGCAAGLVLSYGLSGALIALAVGQAVPCLWSSWLARKVIKFHWKDFTANFDIKIAQLLGGFVLMALVSAVSTAVAQIIIRQSIADSLGWDSAGLWQALIKISETHLLLLTSTLSVYFLPRFSEIYNGLELKREVFKGCIFVIPLVLISSALLFFLRKPLINLALSNQFLSLEEVLPIQLVGDMFKIVSWVFAFTLISHAQTKIFVVTEVIFTVIQVLLTIAMVPYFGLQGASTAYALTYAGYGVAMYIIFNRLVSNLGDCKK